MKTEQTMEAGNIGRQAVSSQEQKGSTMRAAIGQRRQGRRANTILAPLNAAVFLLVGMALWNAHGSTRSDIAVPQAQGQAAVDTTGEHWVPPQAQAYIPRALTSSDTQVMAADFPPQAQGYLPKAMIDAAASCGGSRFSPQAQAYLPCQRRSR